MFKSQPTQPGLNRFKHTFVFDLRNLLELSKHLQSYSSLTLTSDQTQFPRFNIKQNTSIHVARSP